MKLNIDPKVHIPTSINLESFKNPVSGDPLAIDEFDHVEIYSANGRQAVFYYAQTLGLEPVAYRGPETGYREAASYVLRRRGVTFVITTPIRMTSPIAHSLLVHGDTVRAVGLRVPCCEAFYLEAMKRGAVSAEIPASWSDAHGTVKRAAIRTYGDVIHPIIERKSYEGIYWPGFVAYTDIFAPMPAVTDTGIDRIDHIVGNVELGKMNQWVGFYEKVLGFSQLKHFSDDEISTEYSALMSKVMTGGVGKIKFPINEPAEGKRKSQIDEYLDFHNGPGVQHIALITKDVIKTVGEMRQKGIMFLRVPKTYYEDIPNRVGTIKEDLKKISELGILVDRDEDGYLLQLFSKPVHDRPTLFFEIIQREGSQGFGVGNFKALFEAIERDQAQRGNL